MALTCDKNSVEEPVTGNISKSMPFSDTYRVASGYRQAHAAYRCSGGQWSAREGTKLEGTI